MNKNQSFIFVTFATIYIALTLLDGYPFNWILMLIPMLFLIVVTARQLETLSDKVFLTDLVCSTYFVQYSWVRSMFNDRVVQ
ncbi:MAG: hypothetical protein ACI9IA_001020 [Enterobacterales bacterium]|jgi:hypothetical protein